MPEQIISGSGTAYPLIITPEGAIPVSGVVTGSFYATNNSFALLGSAIGSMYTAAPTHAMYTGVYNVATNLMDTLYIDINGNLLTTLADDAGTVIQLIATQADNSSNTTNGLVTSSFGYVFDGSTWDRQRGDSVDGTLVNLGTNNDVTVTSGNISVDSPLDNGRLITAPFANNAGAPVDTTIYNATQSTQAVSIGGYPLGVNALVVSFFNHSTANIITASSTNVKASAGQLCWLTITAGWTGTIAVYDHASTNTNLVCTITNPLFGQMFCIGRKMVNGIRIVTTVTVGTADLLVVYD